MYFPSHLLIHYRELSVPLRRRPFLVQLPRSQCNLNIMAHLIAQPVPSNLDTAKIRQKNMRIMHVEWLCDDKHGKGKCDD